MINTTQVTANNTSAQQQTTVNDYGVTINWSTPGGDRAWVTSSVAPVSPGDLPAATVYLYYSQFIPQDDLGTSLPRASLPVGVGIEAKIAPLLLDSTTLDGEMLSLAGSFADRYAELDKAAIQQRATHFLTTSPMSERLLPFDDLNGMLLPRDTPADTLWLADIRLTLADGTDSLSKYGYDYLRFSNGNLTDELAIFLDASVLPTGSDLELSHTAFAVVTGDVTIKAGTAGGHVYAMAGSQTLIDEGGNGILHGGAGDDQLHGHLHNATLHGGLGHDAAVYSGNMADYKVYQVEGALRLESLAGPQSGIDTLINIEEIRFADQTMALEVSQTQAAITTLYGQILDRQPELGGYAFWNEALEQSSIGTMAIDFLQSAEYAARTGTDFNQLDAAGQVEELYKGILGREADAGGLAFWQGTLTAGSTLSQIAEGFVYSQELTEQYQTSSNWDFSL